MTRIAHPLLATAIAALCALPTAAQQIGTVASSEPSLRGTPPGAATRTLDIGSALVADETVQSSASGRGQLLFADQSTLSLAPNTTVVLDRFVFDPAQGAGEMGLRLTEGALRFIGGTLSREDAATITTPSATIGVRGSSTLVLASGGNTYAVFIAGERLCLGTAGGGTVCTSRQGGVLGNDGYLGEVAPEFLAFLLQLIDGAPLAGQGSGLGSGVGNPNPSDRGPVSTGGEEFDFDIFEDDFDIDTIIGFLEGEVCLPFFFEEGYGEPGVRPNIAYGEVYCFGESF